MMAKCSEIRLQVSVSGPMVLWNKSLPWVDLDLFYGKVNFGHIGF